MNKPRLTKKDKIEIGKIFLDGKQSAPELAKEYQVSLPTIYNWVKLTERELSILENQVSAPSTTISTEGAYNSSITLLEKQLSELEKKKDNIDKEIDSLKMAIKIFKENMLK